MICRGSMRRTAGLCRTGQQLQAGPSASNAGLRTSRQECSTWNIQVPEVPEVPKVLAVPGVPGVRPDSATPLKLFRGPSHDLDPFFQEADAFRQHKFVNYMAVSLQSIGLIVNLWSETWI